jgi:two-component system sensor histidine kinase KdpD
MDEERPLPESLLEVAEGQSKERGKLTIYLGAMPGVGKTYAMLIDARIKKQAGVDIRIGYIETHGRQETEELLEGLDIIEPLIVDYNGIKLREFNLDEVLRLKPKICVVDELPHSNPPGFRNKKRYQDIEELLNAGIDVWTAMNIQHIESLFNIVYQITGVKVRETVPDEFVKNADEIKLIDIPPEELIQRLKEGKVYVPDLAQEAIRKYFRPGNIMALRELSMRIAADKLHKKLVYYMREHAIAGPWAVKEHIVVGVYASPFAEHIVRAAYRVASEIDADWTAIYVETEKHAFLSQKELDWLTKSLELAKSLGAEVVWLKDEDVANAIVRYIRSHNINKVIIGKPGKFNIFKSTILKKIAQDTQYVDIYILNPPVPQSEISFIKSKEKKILSFKSLPRLANLLIGLLCIVLVTIIGLKFGKSLNQLNLVLLFLLALSINAFLLDQYTTLFVTVLSILIFNYFFVPPYYSFGVSDISYSLSYVVLALLIFVFNAVSVRLRNSLKILESSEKKSNTLFELSKKLLRARSKEEINSITIKYIKLFVEEVAIFLRSNDHITLEAVTRSLEINEKVKGIAYWCLQNKKPAGFSTQTFSEEPYLYLPLIYKEEIYGVMILDMSKASAKDYETLSLLETISDLYIASMVKHL